MKRHLADYLEGELPIEDRALVDAHLDECRECASDVDEMLQTIQLLRKLPEPEVPPMIAANVMRRIRAGESQLGFFERVGRVVGGVLETGFVLPASAIAVAALVITVFQGMSAVPSANTPNTAGETAHPAAARLPSSVASVMSSLSSSGAPARSDVTDVAARVERRATRPMGRLVQGRVGDTAPQIRIRLEQFLVAQPSGQLQNVNSVGPVLAPQISPRWAMEGSAWPAAGDGTNGASSGQLVAAQRLGPVESLSGSGDWIQSGGRSGTDPRDAWLALGFEDPAEFARYIAAQNLAEQELWAARLSDRAQSRGLLDEFLERLRDSGDPTAAWVADDFSAQAVRDDSTSGRPKETAPR